MKVEIPKFNLIVEVEWDYKHTAPGFEETEKFYSEELNNPTNGATICKVTYKVKDKFLHCEGVTRCSSKDIFSKEKGRVLSLKRALGNMYGFALRSHFDFDDLQRKIIRGHIWEAYRNR